MEVIAIAHLKFCRCNKLIPLNQKRCESCEVKFQENHKNSYNLKSRRERYKRYNENSRIKERTDFYNSLQWRLIRDAVIVRDNGLCQHCLQTGTMTDGIDVHHIVPIAADWSLRFSANNLILLCSACHRREHRRLDAHPEDNS